MERVISKDLSVLTTIDEKNIDKLFSKIPWCISDLVDKTNKIGETEAVADLGFGKIFISIAEDNVKYKFKPSPELETAIVNTLIEEKNTLTDNIEKNLIYHITHLYKDMF